MPPGYHPLDVEKEWGELHAALLQREKLLRQECDRWGGRCTGGDPLHGGGCMWLCCNRNAAGGGGRCMGGSCMRRCCSARSC